MKNSVIKKFSVVGYEVIDSASSSQNVIAMFDTLEEAISFIHEPLEERAGHFIAKTPKGREVWLTSTSLHIAEIWVKA